MSKSKIETLKEVLFVFQDSDMHENGGKLRKKSIQKTDL